MATKVLSFKVDEQLKEEFTELAKDLGMPVSAMFTVYMKKVISEKGLPFEIKQSDNIVKQKKKEVLRDLVSKLPPAKNIDDLTSKEKEVLFDGWEL